MATIKPLHIVRGKTLSLVIRWEQRTPIISKAITAISFATGFPRLTVASHGIPDGWRSAVVRVAAPKEINSKNDIPRTSDLRETTVIDANTIEYNGLVPVTDGRDWAAYTTGGFVQYHTPKDLTDYEIRVKVKDHVGGTVLLSTELGEVWYNYAVALIKIGKTAEATSVAQGYIERYKNDASRADTVKKFEDAMKPKDKSLDDMVKNLKNK